MANNTYQAIMTANAQAQMAVEDEYRERSVMANSLVSAMQGQIAIPISYAERVKAANTFVKRCKEYYDSHFQELQKKFEEMAVAIGLEGFLGHGKGVKELLREFDVPGKPRVLVFYVPKKGEPRAIHGRLVIPSAIIG